MTGSSPRVAIVGAGPAGLTAAYRLQRAGASVVVLEAEPWVGGRARTDPVEGYRIDTGAQLFGSMYSRLFALAEEVGLGDSLVRSPGRDALWRNGRAHEVVYGSVTSMVTSGGLSFRTKMRLGTTYVPFLTRHGAALDLHAPERGASAGLDRESIARWGEREMGAEFVEQLVYPQLAAYYGALPEETSAGLYHILARDGMDISVYGVRGGSGRIWERVAERIRAGGGEVRPGAAVDRVEVEDAGVRVQSGGWEQRFDGAVLALPAPAAREILAGAPPSLAGWLEQVRFRPALTLALLLDRPAGVRYFGLSFPRAESRSVVAVCVEENKGADLVPQGSGLLVAFARPDRVPELIDAEPRRILDALLPDLRRAFPGVDSRVVRARVYRWRTGNPVLYPGYLERLGDFRGGGPEGGARVALAGDYLYGTSVEGAVTSGDTAARRLLARLRP